MPESNPKPGWQQKIQSEFQDVATQAEQDLHRVIAYINDDVVPDLRRNGIEALRAAATELHRLASRLDDRAGTPRPPRDPDSKVP